MRKGKLITTRLLLFVLLLCLQNALLKAQIFPGTRSSNYTGVNGVFFNPANIVDSRFKWDINLLSADGHVGNNQAAMQFNDITQSINADSLKSKFLTGTGPNLRTIAYVDMPGPSGMFGVGPNTALAITTRARVFGVARDIDGRIVKSIIDANNGGSGSYPFDYNNPQSVVHSTGWTEIGISAAQVFTKKKSNNFFKAGLTIKYLAGVADSYLSQSNMNGTVGIGAGGTYMTNTTGALSLNTTAANFSDYKFNDFFQFNGSGIGGDIGVVYEYRPSDRLDYTNYVDDGFANKYLFKIGLSVMDIGQIKFSKTTNSSASYNVNIPLGDQFLLNQLRNKSITEYKNVFDNSPYFTNTGSSNSDYTIQLPTTVQANIDFNIYKGFYTDLSGQFSLNDPAGLNLYTYNSYSIIPRWENSLFSVEIPVNYNDLTQFNAGFAFRVGPLFVGSGSIITAIFDKSKQADVHAGLRFGMQHKKKIRPDTDSDGVYDDVDKCPAIAGFARYDGCPIPDTDADGINDEEDSCKTVQGLPRYHGCPIPDTDNDGINDEEDSCKDVAGLFQFHGCPDTDGDGIPDPDDRCPTVRGVAKYHGCPIPDTDGDGINDEQDLCPNDPGPASTKGCPLEKIALQITADFKNILFDFGRSTIRPGSRDILVNAARTMNEQIPNSDFYIDGYTDNVGSAAKNKALSKARAQAVATALIAAGVARTRVMARGFGSEYPKCENRTSEGRQCNRRVEVVIRNINQKK